LSRAPEKQNLIKEKSYRFAIDAVRLYQQLRKEGEFVLSKQMLRSATSIGANVEEATAAQSRSDFAAKMAIASKEARETNYWLRLLKDSQICHQLDYSIHIQNSSELIRILTAIVKTTRKENKDKDNDKF
jgi:four helix bundle protein